MEISPRSLALLALVTLLLVAGCTTQAASRPYEISGTFTEDASNEDLEDLRDRLVAYGTTMRVMESFPMQYAIEVDHGQAACHEIETMLEERAYVATIGDCRERLDTGDEDAPTSSKSGALGAPHP